MEAVNIGSIFGYLVGVGGAITIIFSRVKNENLKDLKERVEILEKELVYSREALEKERVSARDQHVENREAIAKLQGQVELYKDLQLKSIAETNKQILKTLQGSATILASGTKTRAKAVEKVKTDLEHSQE